MARHVVASVAALPPGERLVTEIEGRKIVIFNLSGAFYGLLNRCPHQGGDLCRGALTGLVEATAPGEYRYSRRGEILRCPWHGWEFDIRTGKSQFDPARTYTRTYPVDIASGAEIGEGALTAETIPVSVADDYIVVEC